MAEQTKEQQEQAARVARERGRATAGGLGVLALGCACFAGYAVVMASAHRSPWPVKLAAIALIVLGCVQATRVALRIAESAKEPDAPLAGWPAEDDPILQAAADTDAIAALATLGYSRRVAIDTVAAVRRDGHVGVGADAGELVRAALDRL